MKIGIIGAGNIGSSVARNLARAGHEIKIADEKGIDGIREQVADTGATPVELDDVIKDVDVIVMSIPSIAVPKIRDLLQHVGSDVTIIDTSNYYPFRDGKIEEIENGMPESVWVSEKIGRPVVKAFNAALAHTQASKGEPSGSAGRIALPVAGDDQRTKAIALQLVDDAGFDPVDAGSLAESWRQQPGTPAYCTELSRDELSNALGLADKENAPKLREKLIAQFFEGGDSLTHEDIVARNRAVTAPQ